MSGALRSERVPLARLGVFAALGLFVALHWSALLSDPPVGRLLVATLVLVGMAVVMAALGALMARRRLRWPLATLALIGGIGLAALALGVPARLLAPPGWGELWTNLGVGIEVIGNSDYPYTGGGEWSRLAIMLGLVIMLGAGAALAFWPTRAAGTARETLALALVVAAYAIAATLARPDAPLLQGLFLFIGVAAWLWLPRIGRDDVLGALVLVAAAGLIAVPLASRTGGDEPLLDYTNWNLSSAAVADDTEFFSWNHSYGPIGWPRTGRRMLAVRSADPHYWRTAVLDRFDGFRWLEPQPDSARPLELPSEVEGAAAPARLDRRWVHTAYFGIEALSSQLVVGAGSPLSVQGLGGTAPAYGGITPTDGDGISTGDSYSVRAYTPQPAPARMRRAGGRRYQPALRRYTAISLPQRETGTLPAQPGRPAEVEAVVSSLTVPLRPPGGGGGEAAGAAGRLLASPYAGVYRLARRLTRRAPTSYDAVEAILGHLRTAYSYSESPPLRRYPLSAFLFRDRVGYCQQFSGTMALMLRTLGIPSRVASGFSPGTPVGNRFIVSDFDAHSWVEVYFEGIGWVAFDPTPSASPAASISAGAGGRPQLPQGRPLPEIGRGGPRLAAAESGGGHGFILAAIGSILALGAAAVLAMLARRRRGLRGPELAEAQLAELRRALPMMGRQLPPPMTLRRLQLDSEQLGRRGLASYVAKLRGFRYEGATELPGSADRRRLRRELGMRGGVRGALRALRAIPPLGPRPAAGPPASGT